MKHKTFFKHYTIMSKGFEHFEKLFIKMVSNKIVQIVQIVTLYISYNVL